MKKLEIVLRGAVDAEEVFIDGVEYVPIGKQAATPEGFVVGDYVEYIGPDEYGSPGVGNLGKVIRIDEYGHGVEFMRPFGVGHNLISKCPSGHGRFFSVTGCATERLSCLRKLK